MRLKFLQYVYFLSLALILLRLFYWQIVRFDDLSSSADAQHLSSRTLEGERGSILFSDESILASSRPAYLLYGMPNIIKNKAEAALKLATKLTSDPRERFDVKNDLLDKLEKNLAWVGLDNDLTYETKLQIDELKINGVSSELSFTRYYPEASMAAHILGFVGSDSLGRQTGYFGLEGFYNGQLKGVRGGLTEERDAHGSPILSGTFLKQDPKPGSSLVLTVDRSVQYIVEQELKAGLDKYGAKGGQVVVMDPKTGGILAMAAYPSYDPADFTDFPKEFYKNPTVADSFEPGSTFKVLVMAAAINENLIEPDTKCDSCSGPVTIADYQIRTWNNKYIPNLTMTDTIVHSDNTGMVYVGKKLGVDKMYQYIRDFGFGILTGIDLQDETTPEIRPENEWKEIDLATSTFGQGIAVTPIQLIRAVAVVASGGYLMEPHVVKTIQSGDKIIEIKPKIIGTPITKNTADTITKMMVEAVEKGEAKAFLSKGYKIAGKTGTAQIPVAGHYDPTKTIASFVGFAPAFNPNFVMLVRFEEPTASIFGSETAAPTFFAIAKKLLLYFNSAPD